jgi:DNA-binding PadR family transcriptional regulator
MLILWLLAEQSLHGYRIKRILDEASLRYWFPVEIGSIYGALASLVRGGFIEPVAVEREGQRPERTRYRILKEGRKHLRELLHQSWSELPRLGDPIHMALAARSELDEAEVAHLLAEREGALEQRLLDLDQIASSAPAPEMATRARALTRAELEWVRSLRKKTRGGRRRPRPSGGS